jgi:hypothetical protein
MSRPRPLADGHHLSRLDASDSSIYPEFRQDEGHGPILSSGLHFDVKHGARKDHAG